MFLQGNDTRQIQICSPLTGETAFLFCVCAMERASPVLLKTEMPLSRHIGKPQMTFQFLAVVISYQVYPHFSREKGAA